MKTWAQGQSRVNFKIITKKRSKGCKPENSMLEYYSSPYTPQTSHKSTINMQSRIRRRKKLLGNFFVSKPPIKRQNTSFHICRTQLSHYRNKAQHELSVEGVTESPFSWSHRPTLKIRFTETNKTENVTMRRVADVGIQVDGKVKTKTDVCFQTDAFKELHNRRNYYKRGLNRLKSAMPELDSTLRPAIIMEKSANIGTSKRKIDVIDSDYNWNAIVGKVHPRTSMITRRRKDVTYYRPYSRHASQHKNSREPPKGLDERVENMLLERRQYSEKTVEFEKMLKKLAAKPKEVAADACVQTNEVVSIKLEGEMNKSHSEVLPKQQNVAINETRSPITLYVEAKSKTNDWRDKRTVYELRACKK